MKQNRRISTMQIAEAHIVSDSDPSITISKMLKLPSSQTDFISFPRNSKNASIEISSRS